MLAKVTSCAVIGLDGELVEVEVDISSGLPAFNVTGQVFYRYARTPPAIR